MSSEFRGKHGKDGNFSENKGNEAIDTQAPLFVGGVSPELAAYVKGIIPVSSTPPPPSTGHLQGVKSEFGGCIRDLKLNEKKFDVEPKEFNTVPCHAIYENGIFFGPQGGYAILKKEYHIGQTFGADLEVRPRIDTAILLSVGKVEYLAVQLVNGSVKVCPLPGSQLQ